ncbi:MAG: cobalamin-binding protein [Candidatus Omnitrophota bacterium]|jgi:5-methyltetrahydrofolate--homocysteine methyltransferase|nr:MAG: cobalamin-binding protein [Candidatus Omnitrophota bacterium]
MEIYEQIADAIYKGKHQDVRQLVEQCLNEGKSASDVLTNGLVAGMGKVGCDFKENVIFIPEVLIAAKAMKAGMEVLRPKLVETGVQPVAKAVIGTVAGDLHDIGKNLVSMMLEGAGFEVIDIGVDCSEEKYINAVKEHQAQLVGLSAMLTTTMTAMQRIIKAIDASGIRGQIKIMVGGAPLSQKYADEIGADAYAPDAASAVEKAKELVA